MMATGTASRVLQLQCPVCEHSFRVTEVNTFARCEHCGENPLLTTYNLEGLTIHDIDQTTRSMWRYAALLPLLDQRNKVTLGEGWTPILKAERLSKRYHLSNLFIKDESANPTGSFKARGLSMAVSKALELGIETCIVPTAGNAGGALSAYCAKAGMKAIVVMPRHTPVAFKKECTFFGAEVIEVDGLISDCAKKVAQLKQLQPCFDISTMKEPYRLEGKKTMGYEIAEQFNWVLPDVILYPTGGGTGLIGMWKAFQEMKTMGWVSEKMPRMVAVQAQNCMPVVLSFEQRHEHSKNYCGKATFANGLAVPNPFAEKLILQTLCESRGTAIAVSDPEIQAAMKEISSAEGILISPEGAALLPALLQLIEQGVIDSDEKILLLNTGSGYKYL